MAFNNANTQPINDPSAFFSEANTSASVRPDFAQELMPLHNRADLMAQSNSIVNTIGKTLNTVPPEVTNVLISSVTIAGATMMTWWSIKTLVTGENQFFKGI